MTALTLSEAVFALLAIPAPNERIPLDLLRRLVREGNTNLPVCSGCGAEAIDSDAEGYALIHRSPVGTVSPCRAQYDRTGKWPAVDTVPAWGLGVAMLAIGVANHGVDWNSLACDKCGATLHEPPGPGWRGEHMVGWHHSCGGMAKMSGWVPRPPKDPTNKRVEWNGPAHKSGKHWYDGGSKQPYGGLGICHLDSGGLLDAYERWGYPGEADGVTNARELYLTGDGRPRAFDVLRGAGTGDPQGRGQAGRTWRRWLAWADRLLALPEFHVWLVAYWLQNFWVSSWAKGDVAKACMLTRVANSASSWARKWADLSADEIERRYIEAKREARGEDAAKRTKRQAAYARRAAVAINACIG